MNANNKTALTDDQIDTPIIEHNAGRTPPPRNLIRAIEQAAIEADRQRALSTINKLTDAQLQDLAKSFGAGVTLSSDPEKEYATIEFVAPNLRAILHKYGRHIIDHQRRGEPVAWLRNERGNYQGKAVFDPLVLLSAPTPGFYTATYSPVYTAPQPAEPCVAPTLHNAGSGAQNGIQATQPDELMKAPSDAWALIEKYADAVTQYNEAVRIDVGVDKAGADCLTIEKQLRTLLSRYGSGQPATPDWPSINAIIAAAFGDDSANAARAQSVVTQIFAIGGQPAASAGPDDFRASVKKLCIAARTSGGTAGRDEGLCAALDRVEAMLLDQPAASAEPSRCEDCPPVGYPTDKTRCTPCDRRAAPVAREPLKVFCDGPWLFRETGEEFSGAELDSAAFAVYRDHAAPAAAQAQPAPMEAIGKLLTVAMEIAVANGANSVSMPDEYVEVAAWLCGIPVQPSTQDREDALTQAARDVLAERRRQVGAYDWTPEHDDEHADGSLALAAASYATWDLYGLQPTDRSVPHSWPWAASWWKPSSRRRNLVKAGALVLAEIERLDRATKGSP